MHWPFPEQADDLLDVESLPPTENTELNYRTRPITADQELRITLIVLLLPSPCIVALSLSCHFVLSTHAWASVFAATSAFFLAGWITLQELAGARIRIPLMAGSICCVAGVGCQLWDLMEALDANTVNWIGLVATWLTCCLIARQMASWILAGPTVDRDRMERWRVNLPWIVPRGLSLDCPELLTYYAGLFSIAATCVFSGWIAETVLDALWCWPLFLPVAAPTAWVIWHIAAFALVPWPRMFHSLVMTWKAITIFASYDVHHTRAAGVFRFPTKWLRSPVVRWVVLIGVLTATAFSVAYGCPDPSEVGKAGGSFGMQFAANFVVSSVSAPVMLFVFLWLIAGTLLSRFDVELSLHRDRFTSDWDNYVERIINSSDDIESEHYLRGFSAKGDYPILIHKTIQEMHEHVTGDTGASKTSLGIAPLATQLIARAESSVVIVDLKGDRALFESCRREAERTRRMKFRWITNEVGKSTFGFNPFLQTHNRRLTTEQLGSQLLQGMSLDYGIQYGAGYYTAMNEIVLNNVLKAAGSRSFRELSRRLADREWYETIGHREDWVQARHLSALASRLGSSDALNVVPESFSDRPEIIRESIDVTSLFDEPQVVYLSLNSATESTNAPAIARLFLWAAFTAASHRTPDDRRVYFFVDEVQQIISEGMKLIFEQFRGLGGTIIAAHQTSGQLNRDGTNLSDTIDSCTAVKQIFRASDLTSLERLSKLSGIRSRKSTMWMQRYERGTGDLFQRTDPILARDGDIRVSEQEYTRLDTNKLLAIGSRRAANLIRFTFGSGYTQFAGAMVPMVSHFSIPEDVYQIRQRAEWPTSPGAFPVGTLDLDSVREDEQSVLAVSGAMPTPKAPDAVERYLDEFDSRGNNAVGGS